MERFEHGGNIYAHPDTLDFSASLNPLGMPPAAREALVTQVDAFAAYPDPHCTKLTHAIAAFENVDPHWVVPCAGATDAFARICQALRPKLALVCAPCYIGYEQALSQVRATMQLCTLTAAGDFAPDAGFARVISTRSKLVFLANPNNPTGRLLPRDMLIACLERAQENDAIVVLDECFIDLTGHPGSNDLLATYPKLIIVKALTKTFSLAGLRVGYAISSDQTIVRLLNGCGQPWAVSTPAQVAGVAALAEGPDSAYLRESRALIAAERERLATALTDLGCHVVPSAANFLLFQASEPLGDKLLQRGILVRACDNIRGLGPCWHRIAVRTPEENAQLIEALEEVLR